MILYTYQDLLSSHDTNLEGFILNAITLHKTSQMYADAMDAERYARQRNTTIMKYQKFLYTVSGKAVPDNYSANHKCCSNFFSRFVTQENQYLLGNGVVFNNDSTKERLGGDKFDKKLQRLGKYALIEGVAFGFFNYDHLEIFKLTEFVPLWDEEDGSLKAGIRFWQIDDEKPMRIVLYELDGYTDYIKTDGHLQVLKPKRDYKQKVVVDVDSTEIYNAGNYPSFPVVPLWGNEYHQSELIGIKGQIDAYDLIKSGFANDLDDVSQIYWIINNAGGMDDIDLARFIEKLKVVHAATVDDEAKVEEHTIQIPYESRETYLKRLEDDLYNDAMALNVHYISAGNITATAVNAAYEPLNNKTDEYEYCVIDFIDGLLELIGVEDSPTFKRSKISNQSEETSTVLQASGYLDTETILEHLPFLNPDEIPTIMKKLEKEELEKTKIQEKNGEEDSDDEEKEVKDDDNNNIQSEKAG